MPSAKKTTAKPPVPGSIIDYGIAYAGDLFTLAELVKHQISKGFQPCTASGIQYMPHGEENIYAQVMIQYAPALKSKRPNASTAKKAVV